MLVVAWYTLHCIFIMEEQQAGTRLIAFLPWRYSKLVHGSLHFYHGGAVSWHTAHCSFTMDVQ